MNPSSIESCVGAWAGGYVSTRWFRAILPLCTLLGCLAARGDEWFKVYDQTSRVGGEEPTFALADGFTLSTTNTPFGQSFTPVFSGIDFVELYLAAWPPVGVDASETIALRLREGTIGGPILSSTAPRLLTYQDLGMSPLEFIFPNRVELTSGSPYVFEIAHLAGTNLIMLIAESPHLLGRTYYLGGKMISGGREYPGLDVWFREGIYVPEPGTLVLLALGGLGLWAALRPARHATPRV